MSQPSDTAEALLEVRDLRLWFPMVKGTLIRRTVGQIQAVDGVSLSIERGKTLGLVGESGCGKSTVGRAIVGLERPTSGSISILGIDSQSATREQSRRIRSTVQMVFQNPYGSLDPRMTVGSIVSEPLAIEGTLSREQRRKDALDLLKMVGLKGTDAGRYPHEFSGGQRQRIAVARAIALRPALIIADEPVSALDVSVQAQVINLLRSLQRELGIAYLFIAHDLAVVRHISSTVAVMYLGRVVEMAPTRSVYETPRHPYTVALLSAVPLPKPKGRQTAKRIVLTGELPSPSNPPSGCRFHTRCWLRERLGNPERCRTEDPSLQLVGPEHSVACHFSDELGSPTGPVAAGREYVREPA